MWPMFMAACKALILHGIMLYVRMICEIGSGPNKNNTQNVKGNENVNEDENAIVNENEHVHLNE